MGSPVIPFSPLELIKTNGHTEINNILPLFLDSMAYIQQKMWFVQFLHQRKECRKASSISVRTL